MYDADSLDVRALALCAASEGLPIKKTRWTDLIGLGNPIDVTVRHAAESLIEQGTATEVDGVIHIGSPGDGTVADIVSDFLLDRTDSKTHRMHLRQGLGSLFDLNRAPLSTLIEACTRFPLVEAHTLPGLIRSDAEGKGRHPQAVKQRVDAASMALVEAICEGRIGGFAVPRAWIDSGHEDEETQAVLEALAELWVSQRAPTCEAVSRIARINPGTFYRRVDGLVLSGRGETQPGRGGRTLSSVNLRGIDPDTITLQDALVDPSPEIHKLHRRALKALRSYFGLPTRARLNVEAIKRSALAVPLAEIPHLPEAVREHFISGGRSRKTAHNSASAIRAVLRDACVTGRIPMLWHAGADAEWDHAKDDWFPGGPGKIDGAAKATRLRHRWAWGMIREAVRDLRGPTAGPDALDFDLEREIISWLRRRGRWDHAGTIAPALRYAGKRGMGPYADSTISEPLFLQGPGDQTSLEGFVGCLREHGLGEEWEEFFRWYHTWSTASSSELRRLRREFPTRPSARQTTEGTFATRFEACRLVLGVLSRRGDDLTTLTPEFVFSVPTLPTLLNEAVDIWQARSEAGDLPSAVGSSIHGYITSAGLIAEALYRRSKNSGLSPAPKHKVRWGVDPTEEESVPKTATQEALWAAYRDACDLGGSVMADAEAFGTTDNANTTKDIAEVLRETPPMLFHDLQEAYLRLARESLDRDGRSPDHHRLIMDAFLNGVAISTGCRGLELVHMRLDIHCTPEFLDPDFDGDLAIRLRSCDRKNRRKHTVMLRRNLVPSWLRNAYLESRDWAMDNGGLTETKNRFGLSKSDRHQHLFVKQHGGAYGSVGESEHGNSRLGDKKLESQATSLRDRWKNSAGRVLWAETSWECPVQNGRWTLHIIRNVMGYAYFQRGMEQAMNYLGDSAQAIRGAYSGVSAAHISAATAESAVRWDGREVNSAGDSATARELLEQIDDLHAEIARLREAAGVP